MEISTIYDQKVKPLHRQIAERTDLHCNYTSHILPLVCPDEVIMVRGKIEDASGKVFEFKYNMGKKFYDLIYEDEFIKTPFHLNIDTRKNEEVKMPYKIIEVYKNYTMDYPDSELFRHAYVSRNGRIWKNTFDIVSINQMVDQFNEILEK